MNKSYEKLLTKNDTGETGAHQAGIVVPRKNQELISFFPALDLDDFNPDAWLLCTDPDGEQWEMRYIYYNGKTFTPARSTRNEYRITYMTKFFSKWGAKSGDSVLFTSTEIPNRFKIRIKRNDEVIENKNDSEEQAPRPVVLKGWRPVY